MRIRVTPRHGAAEEGEQLYLYTYPHLRRYETGMLSIVPWQEWTRDVQSVGLRTDDGRTWHFTVPRKVEQLDDRTKAMHDA